MLEAEHRSTNLAKVYRYGTAHGDHHFNKSC